MKVPYRFILSRSGELEWYPLLPVRLSNPLATARRSPRFEALVDSGASDCLFHIQLADRMAVDLTQAESGTMLGISGSRAVLFHRIVLHVAGESLTIRAGFCDGLPVPGLLGRKGFFDQFRLLFDPASEPAGLELERIRKT